MPSGKIRINLEQQDQRSWFARLFRRRPKPTLVALEPCPEDAASIDYRLLRRSSVRAVRSFVESIDTYQLHTRRTVHVLSRYVVPPDPGLQSKVPEWLADRVRFGVVEAPGEFGYLRIRSVDVQWDDEGTELYLHLDSKVTPGTRAFIAAYLGDGDGIAEMAELPNTLLLGEPR